MLDIDEDFDFRCVDHLPAAGDEWYTVCGRAHTDLARFMMVMALLSALGIADYGTLLSDRLRSSGRGSEPSSNATH